MSRLLFRFPLSSHHLFGYLLSVRCHCARGLITPITTRNETRRSKEDERNGHGYIIGDRNNARASLFSSLGDLSTAVTFSLSVKTTRKYYTYLAKYYIIYTRLRYINYIMDFIWSIQEKLYKSFLYVSHIHISILFF